MLATKLLHGQLELARQILHAKGEHHISTTTVIRLAELTLALDRALRTGTPFPAAWLQAPAKAAAEAPKALLREQLSLARRILDDRFPDSTTLAEGIVRLAHLVLRLDQAIRNGIPLPPAWSPGPTRFTAILQQGA